MVGRRGLFYSIMKISSFTCSLPRVGPPRNNKSEQGFIIYVRSSLMHDASNIGLLKYRSLTNDS